MMVYICVERWVEELNKSDWLGLLVYNVAIIFANSTTKKIADIWLKSIQADRKTRQKGTKRQRS